MRKAEIESEIKFIKSFIQIWETRLGTVNSTLINLSAGFDNQNSVNLGGFDIDTFNKLDAEKQELEKKISEAYAKIAELEAIVPEDDPADIIIETKNPIISVEGVDFGDIIVGRASTLPITIRNTGDDELKITGYIGLKNSILSPYGWPDVNTETPLIIPVGGSKKLEIQFKPTGVYPINETIRFISNTVGGTNTAVVKGNGRPVPDTGINSILGKIKGGTKRILTLKNVREINTSGKNNPDINSPYFDGQLTNFKSVIVADIWQCYTPLGENKTVQKVLLTDIVISKGVGSFWFEKCDDFIGGLRPAYQYFYDIKDVENIIGWTPLVKEDYNPLNVNQIGVVTDTLGGENASGIAGLNLSAFKKIREYVNTIKEELDNDVSYWGKFDSKNSESTLCERGTDSDSVYLFSVLKTKFSSKSNIKIYGGFSENIQNRGLNISNDKLPDLNSIIQGPTKEEFEIGFISNKTYGRLKCLQPRTGCYIVEERPLNDIRVSGDEVVKFLTRETLPEKIPNHACYRGFRTKYIRGFNWERRYEVLLNCLGVMYTEYEWKRDELLFRDKSTVYEVWEDVEFAGTEIGFSEICIPMDLAKEQESYVDMSNALGCYELYTSKIFHKYPDYNNSGDYDYIKGPEILSTDDYSGLGAGIKLNKKVSRADCFETPVKIYHPLHLGKDIIVGRDNLITKGLFNKQQSPVSYNTSSYQNQSSKVYYHQITDNTVLKNDKAISYFSVAYGNRNGSGSLRGTYELNDSPTKAIYSQQRLLALDSPDTEFKFYDNGVLSSGRKDIYILNFNRDSLTDRLDAGNFEINLKDFGSSDVMSFIDNSGDLLETKFSNDYVYSSFDIVSGSLTNGIHSSGTGSIDTNPNIKTYGKVYPSLGMVIFDAEKIDSELTFNTVLTDNVNGDNAYKLFTAISGAAVLGYHLKARSSSNKKSNHYFVRVSAGTSNYSNNPTMVDETLTNNIIKHEFFKYNPVTYITTVGLYNDSEELLAVAKLSKPVKKTPEKDILIKIRLNW